MKVNAVSIILAGIVTLYAGATQEGNIDNSKSDVKNGLVLRIKPTKPSYHAGEDISLNAEFRNVGHNNIKIAGYTPGEPEEGKYFSWLSRYVIIDANGVKLEISGPIVKSGKEPRLVPIKLAPHEMYSVKGISIGSMDIKLNNEWETFNSITGKYSVQVVYSAEKGITEKKIPGLWQNEVFSNFIEITILN